MPSPTFGCCLNAMHSWVNSPATWIASHIVLCIPMVPRWVRKARVVTGLLFHSTRHGASMLTLFLAGAYMVPFGAE